MKGKASLILALALLSGCASTDATEKVVSGDFCSVIQQPDRFNGRVIAITAFAELDPHYFIDLSDPTCPDKIIMLSIPDNMEKDSNLSAVRAVIDEDALPSKKARVQITGRFIWHPQNVPARILSLMKISQPMPSNAHP